MLNSWRRIRASMCGLFGHKWIHNPHRKLCVYCWKEIAFRYVPPVGEDEQLLKDESFADYDPDDPYGDNRDG